MTGRLRRSVGSLLEQDDSDLPWVLEVPDADRLVVARRHHPFAVCGDGQGRDPARVSLELRRFGAIVRVPAANDAVRCAGVDARAGGVEIAGGQVASVVHDRSSQRGRIGEIPDPNFMSVAAAGERFAVGGVGDAKDAVAERQDGRRLQFRRMFFGHLDLADDAEAEVGVFRLGRLRHRALAGMVRRLRHAAAAHDASLPFRRARRIVARTGLGIIGVEPVGHPLAQVAVHVVQSPAVRRIRSDLFRGWRIGTPEVGLFQVDVVAEVELRRRSRSTRVFPFRLGRQSIATPGRAFLRQLGEMPAELIRFVPRDAAFRKLRIDCGRHDLGVLPARHLAGTEIERPRQPHRMRLAVAEHPVAHRELARRNQPQPHADRVRLLDLAAQVRGPESLQLRGFRFIERSDGERRRTCRPRFDLRRIGRDACGGIWHSWPRILGRTNEPEPLISTTSTRWKIVEPRCDPISSAVLSCLADCFPMPIVAKSDTGSAARTPST